MSRRKLVASVKPSRIYTLMDPDTLEPRFVGATTKAVPVYPVAERFKTAENPSPLTKWLIDLEKVGKFPSYTILESATSLTWRERLVHWTGVIQGRTALPLIPNPYADPTYQRPSRDTAKALENKIAYQAYRLAAMEARLRQLKSAAIKVVL